MNKHLKRTNMLKHIRFWSIFFAFVFLFGVNVTMAHLFFTAYSRDSKVIMFSIDEYGEANMELVMFIIGIPLSTIVLISLFIREAWSVYAPLRLKITEKFKYLNSYFINKGDNQ